MSRASYGIISYAFGLCEQHTLRHRPACAFFARLLESIISKLAKSEISMFYLVCEAVHAIFGWSKSPKTGFLATTPNISLFAAMAAVCSKVVILLLLQNVVHCLLLLPYEIQVQTTQWFLRKRCLDTYWQFKMSGLDKRSKVSLTVGAYIKQCLIRFNISRKYYDSA